MFLFDIMILAPIIFLLFTLIFVAVAIIGIIHVAIKHFRKENGTGKTARQYFTTLIIVAATGIFLTIAGVFLEGHGTSPSVTPTNIMTDGLKSIQSKGFGVTQPKESNFETGTYVLRKEVIDDLPLQPTELEFSCASSSNVCGSDKLVVSKDSIDAKANVKVYITVCGDSAKTRNPKYCVGIGRRGAESRDECITKCQLNFKTTKS